MTYIQKTSQKSKIENALNSAFDTSKTINEIKNDAKKILRENGVNFDFHIFNEVCKNYFAQ